jgi:hypothetical protein
MTTTTSPTLAKLDAVIDEFATVRNILSDLLNGEDEGWNVGVFYGGVIFVQTDGTKTIEDAKRLARVVGDGWTSERYGSWSGLLKGFHEYTVAITFAQRSAEPPSVDLS